MLDEEAFDRAMAADADAALVMLADLVTATDESLRAAARRLAGTVVLEVSRRGRLSGRGTGRLRTVPVHRGGDLDIDASLDAVVGGRLAGRRLWRTYGRARGRARRWPCAWSWTGRGR